MSLTTRRAPIRPQLTRGGALGGLLFVAGLGVLLLVVLLVPPRLVPAGLSPNETVTATNNLRTAIIQVFGGVALLVGAFFTARTYLLSRHSNRVDRFAKAAGSLGDTSRSVRTGGILSMQHLASESKEYWPLVEEMLAVFIREHARPADQQPDDELQSPTTVSSDVRVALRVLGKRPHPPPGAHKNAIDLSRLDLTGVDLQGANLESVRFEGSNLCGAQLSDASLNSASLKDARLEKAELSSADLSYADLRNASLTDAVLYETLTTGTKVWGCELATVQLSDTQKQDMDFTDYGRGAGS